jgi:VanZ family protein
MDARVATMPARSLRGFSKPRLWLAIWGFGWVLAIVLSLIRPPSLGLDVPESDKLGHLLAYFVLSAWAVNLFARPRAWGLAALALVALGIGIEWAQGSLTDTRLRDPRDAVANTIGVALGLLVGLGRLQRLLQALDRRLFGHRS